MKNRKEVAEYISVLIACLYVGYEWWTYSGLYKILAEMQLNFFKEYYIKLTVLLEALIIGGCVGLVIRGLGRTLEEDTEINISASDTSGQSDETMLGADDGEVQTLRKKARRVIIIGLSLIALSLVAAYGVATYWDDPPLTHLVLGKDNMPQSSYVALEGTVQPSFALSYSERSAGREAKKYKFVPVTPPGWEIGDPVQYFIRGDISYYDTENKKWYHFSSREASFRIKRTGHLTKNSLPGILIDEYKRNNLSIGETYYLLESEPVISSKYLMSIITISTIVIVAITGGLSLGYILGARRIEKTQMTVQ